MIAHYICAWYYLYLVQTHVMFIHEMWDADSNRSTQQDSTSPKFSWIWDSLKKEVLSMFTLYTAMITYFFNAGWPDWHVLNYTFFEQWSETEMEEINFFIVAPHWYFRPHMGLLTVCAEHYEGLFWLVSFYLLLGMLPHLYRVFNTDSFGQLRGEVIAMRYSPLQQGLYVVFFSCVTYVGGTLPAGRFYYEAVEGFFGNSFLKMSYQFIYLYLGLLIHNADHVERWLRSLPLVRTCLALGARLAAALQRRLAFASPAC
jgi:hypothetical protein